VQADKMEKKSIFDRLNSSSKDFEMADSTSSEPQLRIVKATSSSIFNRLGGKKALDELERKSIAFSGILKNSPTKAVSIYEFASSRSSLKIFSFRHHEELSSRR